MANNTKIKIWKQGKRPEPVKRANAETQKPESQDRLSRLLTRKERPKRAARTFTELFSTM